MRSIILLVVGVTLISTGVVVHLVVESAFTGVLSIMPYSLNGPQFLLQQGVGVGVIMIIGSLMGAARETKKSKLTSHLHKPVFRQQLPSLLFIRLRRVSNIVPPTLLLNIHIKTIWGTNTPTGSKTSAQIL